MLEQRYHATTQNWFQPDMSNINKITVEAKLISPPTYMMWYGIFLTYLFELIFEIVGHNIVHVKVQLGFK